MGHQNGDYCTCEVSKGTCTEFEDDWGYWDVCTSCEKKLEDGYHYYNHSDGEDHDDIDI